MADTIQAKIAELEAEMLRTRTFRYFIHSFDCHYTIVLHICMYM